MGTGIGRTTLSIQSTMSSFRNGGSSGMRSVWAGAIVVVAGGAAGSALPVSATALAAPTTRGW